MRAFWFEALKYPQQAHSEQEAIVRGGTILRPSCGYLGPLYALLTRCLLTVYTLPT